jgi:hypothetical protein
METEASTIDLDWNEGADLTGCTPMQVKFVQGMVEGLSKYAAYRAAGYMMEGSAGRGAASRERASASLQGSLKSST